MIVLVSIEVLWCFLILEICIGQQMSPVKLKIRIVLTSLPPPRLFRPCATFVFFHIQ